MKISYKYEISKVDKMTFIKIIKSNGFKVTLCDLGASVYEIIHDNTLMTLTPKYPKDFMNVNVYNGKTIGRVTNRIKDAKIKVNNQTYYLDKNENSNTLHSGRAGFSNKYFDYDIIDDEDDFIVKFFYHSPDLEAGFPGEVSVLINYIFNKNDDDSFMEIMSAVSNQKTPLNLTNHLYFTLGESSNKNLQLVMDSKAFLKVDDNKIPVEKCEIKDKYFSYNYSEGFSDTTYDKYFRNNNKPCLDNYFYKGSKNFNYKYPTLVLSSSKYALHILTSLPGIQIYTDYVGDDVVYKNTNNKNNRSIAIEPSYPINQMHFIDEKKPYLTRTIYYFVNL